MQNVPNASNARFASPPPAASTRGVICQLQARYLSFFSLQPGLLSSEETNGARRRAAPQK